jgi:osmotically-inducible protein OsmY
MTTHKRHHKKGAKGLVKLAGGLAAAGGLLLLLNPKHGRTRRARVADRVRHAVALIRKSGSSRQAKLLASLPMRGLGLIASAQKRCMGESVPDDVLVERVRAKLGHVSPDLRRIDVRSREGVVTIEGMLPEAERKPLVKAAKELPGVRAVIERFWE